MESLLELSLPAAIVVFLTATAVIGVGGTKLTRSADVLADVTGWGEAMFGAVLLGATTSLPGIVTSVTAAAEGHAELAFSNALGGIAAQTVFLAIADVLYRPANLEHAAASVANMMQGALLIILLMIVLVLMSAPPITVLAVHPGSIGLVLVYIWGVRMIGQAQRVSTWRAEHTPETVVDRPEHTGRLTRRQLIAVWTRFTILAAVVSVAGYVVAHTGIVISREAGLSETLVGAFFTAIATSLPELVTCIAAVRQGALTLAVGNIIGGNSFDVLFLTFADMAYRPGSLYHALGDRQIFVIALAAILTTVLLLGLLRREKHGIANIGFESFVILLGYAAGFFVLYSSG